MYLGSTKKKSKLRKAATEAAIAGPAPYSTATASTASRYSMAMLATSTPVRTSATTPVATNVKAMATA